MKVIKSWQDTPKTVVSMADAEGVHKRLLLGPNDGTPLMALRVFSVAPGGHTPYHEHDFEHLNVILAGQGVIRAPDGDVEIGPGSVALIRPGETHQFRNTGDEPLHFVCLVPNSYA